METDSLLSEIQSQEVQPGNDRAAVSGSRGGSQFRLRILEGVGEFEELRDAWLAWSDGLGTDLDFFLIQLRHRSTAVRPHVIVVYRNGHPDCMLLGWLDQGAETFRVGPFALFRSEARILRFVYGGFLGNQSRANSEVLVREIMRSLREGEAQAVEFSPLKVDSPLCDLAKRRPGLLCRDHFTPVHTHRYVNLPASFDEFLRGLSKKSRRDVRRHARMLERDFPGRVRLQSVRSERDLEEFARKADEISQKTYQRALGVGFVNNLETREMLRAAAQKSALRACLMYLGDRPVAFAGGIIANRTLYATFTGYDPGFKKYSPGLQTMIGLIKDLFEPSGSPLRVDAGHGDLSYKRALFKSSWEEHPVWIFAPTAKGLGLSVFKLVSTLLSSFAARLLAKSHHLRRLKRNWYRRVLREFQGNSVRGR
jgi:hypothetical protein